MAIYHCTCKIISRGQGRSAVGAAAYRSGKKLYNEYDGINSMNILQKLNECYQKPQKKIKMCF